jgi:hypothetical protein
MTSGNERLRRTMARAYVGVTVVVVLVAVHGSSLLTPAGVMAVLLAPMAVCAIAVLHRLADVADADPGGYADTIVQASVLPVLVALAIANAVLYLRLAARLR